VHRHCGGRLFFFSALNRPADQDRVRGKYRPQIDSRHRAIRPGCNR
jgi:hypothetical protein